MAALRGGENFSWPTSGTNSVGGTDASAALMVGPVTAVSVFIENTGATSATFTIQASGNAVPVAGRNNTPTKWYDYQGATGIVVASGATICVDLTPFGPEYVRLKRTDAGATTTISAFATGLG